MRTIQTAILLLALLGSACDRPATLVVCHNANCAGPPDPFRDDTLEAMRESFDLTFLGRPVLDGMEFDIFWHGDANNGNGRCLFAHDLVSGDLDTDAQVAADEVARYLERPGEISWNGEFFLVRVELKGSAGPSYYDDAHTPAQARQHAECALDLYNTIEAAALGSGRNLEFIFDSYNPDILNALTQSARWPGRQPHPSIRVRLSADYLDSTPSGLAIQMLSDFPEVDDVVFHAGWVTDGHYQAFRSMGLDLTLWMFSATVETFAAIEKFEPRAVLTSEAPLMRRWLEY